MPRLRIDARDFVLNLPICTPLCGVRGTTTSSTDVRLPASGLRHMTDHVPGTDAAVHAHGRICSLRPNGSRRHALLRCRIPSGTRTSQDGYESGRGGFILTLQQCQHLGESAYTDNPDAQSQGRNALRPGQRDHWPGRPRAMTCCVLTWTRPLQYSRFGRRGRATEHQRMETASAAGCRGGSCNATLPRWQKNQETGHSNQGAHKTGGMRSRSFLRTSKSGNQPKQVCIVEHNAGVRGKSWPLDSFSIVSAGLGSRRVPTDDAYERC